MSEESQSGTSPEKPKSVQKATPPKPELMSPRDHAVAEGHAPKKGKAMFSASMGGQPISMTSAPRGSVAYEVAKTAHGWREHEHHTGKPIQLSRADFIKALEVAATYNAKGESNTHPAALSEHKGKAV